ncbi:TmcC family electron transfer complex membrane anchor subunit [Megalodesulfovibrio gigas]|uniref:Putative nitrate reductase, subunit gamma n=1 Tax=Megalodesulfovibrio gigas (strain ATCC 19364 / DSM 1382 / NCIMB 9332 / VKM B-1759) TaxID=1121448 RepID=T2GC79_MEGG1|nr:hypothetical protein [Megalodesulfovibrio gigas]AGW13517.1 putative nitrate reductase, subunit gamma [Megalodesulfovibrio gigas DSM 1382 = ATCC 19364]
MEQLYALAVGPLAWAAAAIFVFGSLYRLVRMYNLAKEKDGQALAYMSWKFGLRSLAHWFTPFGSLGWKENPLETIATFVFHIGLILLPLVVLGHVVLVEQFHGFSWWSPPEMVTDIVAMVVVVCCAFFALRRLMKPEVRFVTSGQDWLVLIIACLPFLTGVLAYHHVGPNLVMTTLHILSGELMLVAIPFTRLSHMLFGLFSRAYTGSEFGGVRHANDW